MPLILLLLLLVSCTPNVPTVKLDGFQMSSPTATSTPPIMVPSERKSRSDSPNNATDN